MKRAQGQRRAGRGQDAGRLTGKSPALRRNQPATSAYDVCIDIGGMPILLHTGSAEFARLLEDRYGPFVVRASRPAEPSKGTPAKGSPKGWADRPSGSTSSLEIPDSNSQFPVSSFELEVELVPPGLVSDAEDARVRLEHGRWVMERGDFRAEWDPERRRGWVRQSPNPYSIDSVLRILHSLILAREGGFLVHAASAVRNGRAFLFAGVSGAGKTTISRLAPPEAILLTDEISYVREVRRQKQEARSKKDESRRMNPESIGLNRQSAIENRQSYEAFGTPFAGELARIGENLRAPVAALYLLAQGAGNRFEAVSQADAARALLRNILFFAQDEELVRLVTQSALDFVSRVPVRRLVFARDSRVWELIGQEV